MAHYLWLIPLGFLVGAYGTLIGAGGGFVLMPILLLLYPEESPELLASMSLAVVFFNAASGSVAYGRMRRIDYKSGLALSAATVPGAVLGALTTGYVPRQAFDAILGCLMVLACGFLLWHPMPPRSAGREQAMAAGLFDRSATNRIGTYNMPLGLVLSFVAGYLSSLLGIGGGIIHVPVLVHLLSFPVHVATATSHFMLAIMSLAGTAVRVDSGVFAHGVRRTIFLAIGVVIGAQVGAWLSGRLRGRWIVRGLAIALGLVGVRVLLLAFEAGR
jgi:hypothetical protein